MTEKQEREEEKLNATTYTIIRTGARYIRHYQIDKMIMGVSVDKYWVHLKGRDEVWCDCPGFRRQTFPKMEHKHVKIAQDFNRRNEPIGVTYKIIGTGAKTEIVYLGVS